MHYENISTIHRNKIINDKENKVDINLYKYVFTGNFVFQAVQTYHMEFTVCKKFKENAHLLATLFTYK